MILTTHAIVGAALPRFIPPPPFAAAVLGFASHFVIDAIPHCDYPIRSPSVQVNRHAAMVLDRALFRDVTMIGVDGFAGLILAAALFGSPATIGTILAGALAAMLPDPLQFLHARLPREPLRTLQRFHVWMHTNLRLDDQVLVGVFSQLAFVIAVIALTAWIQRILLGTSRITGWGIL